MGSLAVAGQFQQRPTPRGGGFFEWQNVKIVDVHPRIIKTIRYWDKAGTEGAVLIPLASKWHFVKMGFITS